MMRGRSRRRLAFVEVLIKGSIVQRCEIGWFGMKKIYISREYDSLAPTTTDPLTSRPGPSPFLRDQSQQTAPHHRPLPLSARPITTKRPSHPDNYPFSARTIT